MAAVPPIHPLTYPPLFTTQARFYALPLDKHGERRQRQEGGASGPDQGRLVRGDAELLVRYVSVWMSRCPFLRHPPVNKSSTKVPGRCLKNKFSFSTIYPLLLAIYLYRPTLLPSSRKGPLPCPLRFPRRPPLPIHFLRQSPRPRWSDSSDGTRRNGLPRNDCSYAVVCPPEPAQGPDNRRR